MKCKVTCYFSLFEPMIFTIIISLSIKKKNYIYISGSSCLCYLSSVNNNKRGNIVIRFILMNQGKKQ